MTLSRSIAGTGRVIARNATSPLIVGTQGQHDSFRCVYPWVVIRSQTFEVIRHHESDF
jgi:hypothetical protein